MDEKPRFCLNLFFISIGITLVVSPLFWFPNDHVYLWGDDGSLYFLSPGHYLKKTLFCWTYYNSGVGSSNPFMPSHLPFASVIYLLQVLGFSPGLSEKVIWGFTLFGAFIFTFLFLKEILEKPFTWEKYIGALIGALAFALSPIVILVDWTLLLLEIYLIAILPALFFFYLRYLRSGRFRWLFFGVLTAFFFSASLTQIPWLGGFLLGFACYILIYYVFVLKKELALSVFLSRNFKFLILVALVNAFWILPTLFSSHYQSFISEGFIEGAEKNVLELSKDLNLLDYFLNLFPQRFHQKYGEERGYDFWFYGFKYLNLFIPFFIGVALLMAKGKYRKLLLALVTPCLLLIYFSTVNVGPWGIKFFIWLTEHIPGWFMFRNFYSKFPLSFAFFYSLLLGYSIFILITLSARKLWVKIGVVGVLLIFVIRSIPFLNGEVVNRRIHSERKEATVTLFPERFKYVCQSLNYQNDVHGILSFPFLSMSAWGLYKWGNGFQGHNPAFLFLDKPFFNDLWSFGPLAEFIQRSLFMSDWAVFKNLMRLLGISHIWYSNDFNFSHAKRLRLLSSKHFDGEREVLEALNEIEGRRIGMKTVDLFIKLDDLEGDRKILTSPASLRVDLKENLLLLLENQLGISREAFVYFDGNGFNLFSSKELEEYLSGFDRVMVRESLEDALIGSLGKSFLMAGVNQGIPFEKEDRYYIHFSELKKLHNDLVPDSRWIPWQESWQEKLEKNDSGVHLIKVSDEKLKKFKDVVSTLKNLGFVFVNEFNFSKTKKEISSNQTGLYELIGQFSLKSYFKKTGEGFSKVAILPRLEDGRFFANKKILSKMKMEGVNCSFKNDLQNRIWKIKAEFDGDEREDEFLKIQYPEPGLEILREREDLKEGPIDLRDFPYLAITYRVEDPSVQTLQVLYTVKTEKKEDRTIALIPRTSFPKPASSKKSTFVVELLRKAEETLPGRKHYYLSSLEILPHKLWGVDCSKEKRAYLFELYDMSLLRHLSLCRDQDLSFQDFYTFLDQGKFRFAESLEKIPEDQKFCYYVQKEEGLNTGKIDKFDLILRDYEEKMIEVLFKFDFEEDKAEKLIKKSFPVKKIDRERSFIEIDLKQVPFERGLKNSSTRLSGISLVTPAGKKDLWRYNLETYSFEHYRKSLEEFDSHTDRIDLCSLDGVDLGERLRVSEKEPGARYYFKLDDLELKKGKHLLELKSDHKLKWDWLLMFPKIENQASVSPKIEFKKINLTRYVVNVRGARQPFWLIFNESFHPNWKAYIRKSEIRNPLRRFGRSAPYPNGIRAKSEIEEPWSALFSLWKDRGKRFEIPFHVEMNGFANGWLIDRNLLTQPDFQVVIEFTPQRFFESGLLLSLGCFLGCFGYGIFRLRRKGVLKSE